MGIMHGGQTGAKRCARCKARESASPTGQRMRLISSGTAGAEYTRGLASKPNARSSDHRERRANRTTKSLGLAFSSGWTRSDRLGNGRQLSHSNSRKHGRIDDCARRTSSPIMVVLRIDGDIWFGSGSVCHLSSSEASGQRTATAHAAPRLEKKGE